MGSRRGPGLRVRARLGLGHRLVFQLAAHRGEHTSNGLEPRPAVGRDPGDQRGHRRSRGPSDPSAPSSGAYLSLAALAVLTHRVVDGGPDGFRDVWLGVPVTTIRAYAETDPSPRDCRIALVPALCVTRGGRQRSFTTLVPFRPAR